MLNSIHNLDKIQVVPCYHFGEKNWEKYTSRWESFESFITLNPTKTVIANSTLNEGLFFFSWESILYFVYCVLYSETESGCDVTNY